MKIFGFEFKRNKPTLPTIVAPVNDDGATTVSTGGYYAQVMEMDTAIKNENDLIRRYREAAQYPDCDRAIDDIVNEAISVEDDKSISLVLDDLKIPNKIKEAMHNEFDTVLNLLKYNFKAHDLFRSWYIDGRLAFYILVDEKNKTDGIQELRQVDPRKIRKIRAVKKTKTNSSTVNLIDSIDEYYVYNEKGIMDSGIQGVKLPKDSVVYISSGLMDNESNLSLSYLHKAIRPVNQLKLMENALVIYRLARSAERRIFYIDVGTLSKQKAEQHVREYMNNFRNKIVYDANTGEIKDDKRHMSLMEDLWMPRREGGKGTEIGTLPGGENLGVIDDVEFFQNKLYQSLNVPIGRLTGQTGFSLGRASEITRDEIKFAKFIAKLRKKYSELFATLLKTQLILKEILTLDEWDEIKHKVRFDYVKDNYYAELKNIEILQSKLSLLGYIDPYVGKYVTEQFVKKSILGFTDEQIEADKKVMETEHQYRLDVANNDSLVQAQAQLKITEDQTKMQQKLELESQQQQMALQQQQQQDTGDQQDQQDVDQMQNGTDQQQTNAK